MDTTNYYVIPYIINFKLQFVLKNVSYKIIFLNILFIINR